METHELDIFFKNEAKIGSSSLKQKLFKHGLKERKCENCGITEWMGKAAPLELHHINGINNDNSLVNLQIICPNCHSQTDNFRASNQSRVKIQKPVEEICAAILDSYNPRQALIKLGYAPMGANYGRIKNIVEKYNLKFREMTEEEIQEEFLRKREAISKLQARRREVREEKIKNGEIIPVKVKRENGNRICYRTPDELHTENRKVSRPSKEKLLSLLWRKPMTTLAKEFGVSDNAIRKWAKSYKIPFPPRGYWAKMQHGHKEECLAIKRELFSKFGLKW